MKACLLSYFSGQGRRICSCLFVEKDIIQFVDLIIMIISLLRMQCQNFSRLKFCPSFCDGKRQHGFYSAYVEGSLLWERVYT